MNDLELLRAAINASGLDLDQFADGVLDVSLKMLNEYLEGGRPLSYASRFLCARIVEEPELARDLIRVPREEEGGE